MMKTAMTAMGTPGEWHNSMSYSLLRVKDSLHTLSYCVEKDVKGLNTSKFSAADKRCESLCKVIADHANDRPTRVEERGSSSDAVGSETTRWKDCTAREATNSAKWFGFQPTRVGAHLMDAELAHI